MRRFFTLSLVLTGLLFLAHMSFSPESPADNIGTHNSPQGTQGAANDARDAAESGSEAAEAAANAAEAAEAAKTSKEAVDAAKGAGGSTSAVSLSTPGQGVTAGRGHSPSDGVSDKDRASLDKVSVNKNSWSPF